MPVRLRSRSARALTALALLGLAPACATPPQPAPPSSQAIKGVEIEVYHKAETERAAQLAREVKRLRADLAQAEDALVMAESGLRGEHTRADAVSSLAEARIQVERAAERAPWRAEAIAEALSKLDEASRQIEESHYGSALFFVYRAQRSAENVEAEADRVLGQPGVRYVGATRVNMRAGPSTTDPVLRVLERGMPVFTERSADDWTLVRASTGDIGWVHRSLLQRP